MKSLNTSARKYTQNLGIDFIIGGKMSAHPFSSVGAYISSNFNITAEAAGP
jgi:hypothetical protein